MAKTSKHIRKAKRHITDPTELERGYTGLHAGEFHYPDEITAWGPEMLNWLRKEPMALSIQDWIDHKGIEKSMYYAYLHKEPLLKHYHELAKTYLGCKREKGMVFIKLGMRDGPLKTKQKMYDAEWAEAEEREILFKAYAQAMMAKYMQEKDKNDMPEFELGWKKALDWIREERERERTSTSKESVGQVPTKGIPGTTD